MAIPIEKWKNLIEVALRNIASEEYQKLAWFNQHPSEISSPTEEIAGLLDDCRFEDYVESLDSRLTTEQKAQARKFLVELRTYARRAEIPLDPYSVMADPAWRKIRNDAEALINVLFEV